MPVKANKRVVAAAKRQQASSEEGGIQADWLQKRMGKGAPQPVTSDAETASTSSEPGSRSRSSSPSADVHTHRLAHRSEALSGAACCRLPPGLSLDSCLGASSPLKMSTPPAPPVFVDWEEELTNCKEVPDEDDDEVSGLSPLDTALMQAVAVGDAEKCRQLVAAGADVNLTTSGGKPLLFYALMRAKDGAVIKILLSAEASVHGTDVCGNRVLHLWARAKRARDELLEVGEALICAGAELDVQRRDGLTPMHLLAAGHNNHRDWLDFHKAALLVRHGAKTGVVAPCGRAPLDMIQKNQRAATARFLRLLRAYQGCTVELPRCNQKPCPWCNDEGHIFSL